MPSDQTTDFRDDLLLQTFADSPGSGDDAGQPTEVRFFRAVSRLVRDRLRVKDDPSPSFTIFLLSPDLRPTPPGEEDPKVQPTLNASATAIEARAWCTNMLANFGTGYNLAGKSEDECVSFVVEDLGLGKVPAVIFDSRVEPYMLRLYKNGLDDLGTVEPASARPAPVTLDEVFDVIDSVHKTKLLTPNRQSQELPLWEDKDRGYPSDTAELRVQAYLEAALIGRFKTCTIRCEQPELSGRLDIEIEEPDATRPGAFIRHVLLELKVLRSLTSGGKRPRLSVKKTIDEGVDQAVSYRDDRGTLAAALCCFDMRARKDGANCFRHVRAKAAANVITLKVWPVHSSLKEFRHARAEAAVPNASATRTAKGSTRPARSAVRKRS